MSRPVSPRMEDQVMFGNGCRIMWKAPAEMSPNDLNLQVKECNIVVTFNAVAFSAVRKTILDYYKEHPDFTIVYVTDTSLTNERLDKFKITKTSGNGTDNAPFTITFTNNKMSALVNGRLTDVYRFVLNEYNDIERLIHLKHTENTLVEKKGKDVWLELPHREWSPFVTPNGSRRESFTSSTLSLISDQDTSESFSGEYIPYDHSRTNSGSGSRPSTNCKSRNSVFSPEDLENDVFTDSQPEAEHSGSRATTCSQASTLKSQSSYGSKKSKGRPARPTTLNAQSLNAEYQNDAQSSSRTPVVNGNKSAMPVPLFKLHSTGVNAAEIKQPFDNLHGHIPKFRKRKPASHFMFAVHLVNIQRQINNVQCAIVAMETKINKTMAELKTSNEKQHSVKDVNHDWLLDRIQAIIREELRMVKDEVDSSKAQSKTNRELIKRVYVEINNRISKEVSDIQARLAKLEKRETRKKSRQRGSASDVE